jgi:flagellar motor switch protein FliM
MVVLVTLETKVGEVEGMINFCIPYLTIEPIISKLSAQYMYSSVRSAGTTENLNTLKERLASIDVTVLAEIGSMNLQIKDVLALQAGDTIRLPNTRITDNMVLRVGSRPKFLCRPGVVGNKVAIQITNKLEDINKEEFEELAVEGEE